MYRNSKVFVCIISMTVLYGMAAPAAVRYEFMPDHAITMEEDDEGCTRLGLLVNGERKNEYRLCPATPDGGIKTLDTFMVSGTPYILVLFHYGEFGTRGVNRAVDLFIFKIQKSSFVLLKQYPLIDIYFYRGTYYQYKKLGCMCTHNGKTVEIQIYDECMNIVDSITVMEEKENVRNE